MGNIDKTITTAEFSKQTGLPVSTITKLLRQGKLAGEKRKGKWAIAYSELQNRNDKEKDLAPSEKAPRPSGIEPTKNDSYTVEQFAKLTYLTEKGVRQWLRTGRLTGTTEPGGSRTVNADNLSRPELNHIIR